MRLRLAQLPILLILFGLSTKPVGINYVELHQGPIIGQYKETRGGITRGVVGVARPVHPTALKIREFYRDYGSPLYHGDFVDELVDVCIRYQVDPVLVAGLSVLESGAGRDPNAWNYFGYDPGNPRYRFNFETVEATCQTLRRYHDSGLVTVRQKAIRWKTVDIGDYPERLERVMQQIKGG